jgi:hypothetical protein
MTGYLIVRLAPLLGLLPGVELRAGDVVIAAGVPISLPPGPATLTVSVRFPLRRGRLDARLGVPVWIEPGGTTTVDLAQLAHAFAARRFDARAVTPS